MAGERLSELMGGKGNVILLRYQVGSASTEEREKGFLDAIKKHPDLKVISADQHAGPTRDTAYRASQNILNRFGGTVNGIFCPCELPSGAMAMALRDIGKGGGKVKLVGFDAARNPSTICAPEMCRTDRAGPGRYWLPWRAHPREAHTRRKGRGAHRYAHRPVTRENMDQPEMRELLNPPLDKYLK